MNQLPWPMGPQPFDFKEGSGATEWKNWLRGFEIFAEASNISDGSKKNWLLHYGGSKVQSVYFNTPKMSAKKNEKKSARSEYRRVAALLTSHFAPERNKSYERHIFRKMSQRQDERVDEFVMRLRIQADRCEFGRRIDENIKDQITATCNSNSLRRKLLERNHKSLHSVLKLCRVHEAVSIQDKTFGDDLKRQDDVQMGPDSKEPTEVCNIRDHDEHRKKYYSEGRYECGRCASKSHKSDDKKCPAKGKKCERCGKMDHFARKCRSKVSADEKIKSEVVRLIEPYDDYDDTF